MELFADPERLERYLLEHSGEEDPVLKELSRHTYLHEVHPRMLSGHILGSFLHMFSSLLAPTRILEIGTYTGYSAICLARGLRKGGRLTTIEINEELRDTATGFFQKAGLEQEIELINGDALKLIPSMEGSFDLVFMDAHKEAYPDYYRLVFERVVPGGYILADNALWGGKVLDSRISDSTTLAIDQFNQMVNQDPRVKNLLLPLRDGLMLIKKL